MSSSHIKPVTRLMQLLNFFGWFPSACLHRLGCLFVGSPEALGLPSNFWVSQPDRLAKEPEVNASMTDVRVGRIRVNHFRVLLTPRVAFLAFALSMTFCLGIQAVLLGANGIAQGWRAIGFSHSASGTSAEALNPSSEALGCAKARRAGAAGTGMDPNVFSQQLVARCGERPSPAEQAAAKTLTEGALQ
jgi:hypothetical protein